MTTTLTLWKEHSQENEALKTGPKKTFAIKFTFPFITSEEINGTTQKLCQKDFILKVAARDFVHRFTSQSEKSLSIT